MTEAEAHTKLCCGPAMAMQKQCKGVECMAWRWLSPKDVSPRNGFCGLAIKPVAA